MRIKLPAIIIDLVEDSNPGGLVVGNQFPADGATNVRYSIDGVRSSPIVLSIIDLNNPGGIASVTIDVSDSSGTTTVWDGTAFHPDWSTSTRTALGATGSVEIEHFVLYRNTPWSSEDTVTVSVSATSSAPDSLNVSYSFTIEDVTQPTVANVYSRGLDRVVVEFSEPMEVGTGTPTDVCLVRTITGGISVENPDVVRSVAKRFIPQDVGKFICIEGAEDFHNDGAFEIVEYLSEYAVRVNYTGFVNETLPGEAIISVSPYRLRGVLDAEYRIPVFTPIPIGCEYTSSSRIELVMSQELSPGRDYDIDIRGVADSAGNLIPDSTLRFTAEEPAGVQRRRSSQWSILDLIPQVHWNLDSSRDLERFVRVLDDVFQVLMLSIDQFNKIYDIDRTPFIDTLLDHLGNPFKFANRLSDRDKRRLAKVLVDIYKRKGTEVPIESFIQYVLGFTCDLQPFFDADAWILGEDALEDYDPDTPDLTNPAILGLSERFYKYAFKAVVDKTLSDWEREALIEIIDKLKPAHTHLIAIEEPPAPALPPPDNPWILDEPTSLLGESELSA